MPGERPLHRLRREHRRRRGAGTPLRREQRRCRRPPARARAGRPGRRSRPSARRPRTRSRRVRRAGRSWRRGAPTPDAGRRRPAPAALRPGGRPARRRGSAPSHPAGRSTRDPAVGEGASRGAPPRRARGAAAGTGSGRRARCRRRGARRRPRSARSWPPMRVSRALGRLRWRPSVSATALPEQVERPAPRTYRSPHRRPGRRGRRPSTKNGRHRDAVVVPRVARHHRDDVGRGQLGHRGRRLRFGSVGDDDDPGGRAGERGARRVARAPPRTCRRCRNRWRGTRAGCCARTPRTATRAAPPPRQVPVMSAAAPSGPSPPRGRRRPSAVRTGRVAATPPAARPRGAGAPSSRFTPRSWRARRISACDRSSPTTSTPSRPTTRASATAMAAVHGQPTGHVGPNDDRDAASGRRACPAQVPRAVGRSVDADALPSEPVPVADDREVARRRPKRDAVDVSRPRARSFDRYHTPVAEDPDAVAAVAVPVAHHRDVAGAAARSGTHLTVPGGVGDLWLRCQ